MIIHALLSIFRKGCVALLFIGVAISTAHATNIILVNQDSANEGFKSNAAPFAGQTGNPGTTLGGQRLAVFQAAADYWEGKLVSNVTIRIEINFDPLECDASGAVLGSAGPNSAFRDFANAPTANTWFVEAVANSRAGSDLDGGSNDIGARFNSDIDNNNSCLNNTNWWYGINSPAPSGTISLFDTVLHEIGHGIGFLSLVNSSTGTKFQGLDDAYMRHLYDASSGAAWPNMNNSQRAASAINTGNLVWDGTNANSNSSHLSAGKNAGRIRMFAPNPIQGGSSVSHWDTALSPDELMEPFATTTSDDTSTIQLLKDVGWQIVEGPGEVGFSKATYAVFEDKSNVLVTVNRVNGGEGPVSLNVSTIDGTALAGLDYTATNVSLNWADGDSESKFVFISVTEDMLEEPGGESFTVQITGITGGATSSRLSATVKIRDPDTDDFLLTIVPAILAATKQPDEPVVPPPPPPTVFPRWSEANDVCCGTSSANFTVVRGSDRRDSLSPSCSVQSRQSSEANGSIGSNSFSWAMNSSGCGPVNGGFSTTFRESTRYLFVAVFNGSSIGVDLYSAPFSVAELENEIAAPQGTQGMTLEESVSIPIDSTQSYQSRSATIRNAD